MKIKKIIILALILFSSIAYAQTTDLAIIKINVDQSGNSSVQHLLVVDSQEPTALEFAVFDDKNLRVYDSSAELEYTIENGKIKVMQREFVQNYSLTIEYTSSKFTSKQGENWFFDLIISSLQAQNIQVDLSLPENARLLSNNPNAIVFFENQKLNLNWELSQNQATQLSASYSLDNTQGTPNYSYLIFVIASLIVIAVVTYFLFVKKPRKIEHEKTVQVQESQKTEEKNGFSEKQKDTLKLLTENESRVMLELSKEDSITQRALLVRTGLPKSTLSRTIKKLELKGLVKSLEIGNTNRIELTEEFKAKKNE